MDTIGETLGITRLSPDERLALMEESWESLDDAEIPIPDWQRELLDRRLEANRANPKAGSTWEEARARIMGD